MSIEKLSTGASRIDASDEHLMGLATRAIYSENETIGKIICIQSYGERKRIFDNLRVGFSASSNFINR